MFETRKDDAIIWQWQDDNAWKLYDYEMNKAIEN